MYLCKNRRPESFNEPVFTTICSYWGANVKKFSLLFQGPEFFNSLSNEIQNASGIAVFNYKLKLSCLV